MLRRVPVVRPFGWLLLTCGWALSSCGDGGDAPGVPSRFAVSVVASGTAADSGTYGTCQTIGQVDFSEQGPTQWTGLASGTFDINFAGRRFEAAIGGPIDTSGQFLTAYELQILPNDSVRLEFSQLNPDPATPRTELRALSGILRADFTMGGTWTCFQIPDSLGTVPIVGAWSLLPS